MRTALRWVIALVLALAASAALARSPVSNGCGDGEANVPFAGMVTVSEVGGGSGEPGLATTYAAAPVRTAVSPLSNGVGDGEANVPFAGMTVPAPAAEEPGGGSGEPAMAPAEDEAARAAREAEFERHVWTDP